MANQTHQLSRLLAQEGVNVEIVQVNMPYRPAWIESLRGVRALFRLVPFLIRLWHVAGHVQLFHVLANSGWAWHLFAAPAVWIARMRALPVIVNYHGGEAGSFFERSFFLVRPSLQMADAITVPSEFLKNVFAERGVSAEIVPNVVDLTRFCAHRPARTAKADRPHIIVTRNLEPIYDIGTALHAFAIFRKTVPDAQMTIAGSGPERSNLEKLARTLGLTGQVAFTGRLDNEHIAALYQQADLFLNPSLVDNMPVSILEALASGVPVVSTDVGGIPLLVEDGKTALLVPPRDADAMARALLELLNNPATAQRLAAAGCESVQQYTWQNVRGRLFSVYSGVVPGSLKNAAEHVK